MPTNLEQPTNNYDPLYIRISRRKLKTLEKEAAIGRKFLDAQKKKQYVSTKLGRLLHAVAMAYCTKIGVLTMEKIITLVTAAFCANIGLANDIISGIVDIRPSVSTLKT